MSLICQLTSDDIKAYFIICIRRQKRSHVYTHAADPVARVKFWRIMETRNNQSCAKSVRVEAGKLYGEKPTTQCCDHFQWCVICLGHYTERNPQRNAMTVFNCVEHVYPVRMNSPNTESASFCLSPSSWNESCTIQRQITKLSYRK